MSAFDMTILALESHEGYKRFPYRDTVGKLTIGYGRNLDDAGIYPGEAEWLLKQDLIRLEPLLERAIPIYTTLDISRQSVLLNMAFNIGLAGLLKFKKMLAALEARDFRLAAAEMLDSKWAQQVSRRAQELADIIRGDTT